MPAGPRLGIDFGTSHTVGMIAWPDGRVRPLLFDGSPLLPSAVCAEPVGAPGQPNQPSQPGTPTGQPGTASPNGQPASQPAVPVGQGAPLLVGRDAVHAARIEPARFEGTPKRRIDDGSVLLGDQEYPVAALIAAVLTRVREEAVRVLGGQPAEVVLSHPAAWGVSRRLTLLEGAKQAGLGEPSLVPEPVAAARYFAEQTGVRFPAGHGLLVYDFGGGTFDASLVVRGPDGYDVSAIDGIDDLGGVDLDELLVGYAGQQLGTEHAAAWQRLSQPQTAEDRRHRRMLWDDARMVKERLSRTSSTTLHVPLAGVDVTVPREAFEDLARSLLERTARTTAAVLRWSGLPKEQLVGVFLVGGSSRIPLVSTLLEREIGLAPTVMEQPELVVAEGALRSGGTGAQPGPAGQQPPERGGVAPTPVSPAGYLAGSATGSGALTAAPAAQQATQVVPQQPGPAVLAQSAPVRPGSPAPGQISGPPHQVSGPPQQVSGPPHQASGPPHQVSAPPGGVVDTTPLPQVHQVSAPPQPYRVGQVYQPAEPAFQPAQSAYPPAPPAYHPQAGQYPPAPRPPQQYSAQQYPPQPYPAQPVAQPVVQPAAQPAAAPAPQSPPPAPRAWWPPFLAALFVLAVLAAGYAVIQGSASGQESKGSGPGGGSSSQTATQPAYQRKDRPEWLPSGWQLTVGEPVEKVWLTSDEKEGGRCEANADSLHVTRSDPGNLTGCTIVQPGPLDRIVYAVAIEAEITVEKGCAGLWARTGSRGYFLAVCDGTASLHLLGDGPVTNANRLAEWKLGYRPQRAIVGFMASDNQLTVYVSGKRLGNPVQDSELRYGKITVGGYPGAADGVDATIRTVRIFTPADQPQQNPTSQRPSPSKSPSWRPSPSVSATTSWRPPASTSPTAP